MSTLETSPFDFLAAAASHFADRPTLRAVASQQLLRLLLKQLPYLEAVQPPLTSADSLTLDSPEPGTAWWTTRPLVDALLKCMAQGEPMDIEPLAQRTYNLGLAGPHRFAGATSDLDTRALAGLSESLNELIEQLPGYFAEAQVAFWRSCDEEGVSRDRWFQLLLKQALLRNLPLQGLDTQQQACVRGLLLGEPGPSVFAVQVTLTAGGQSFQLMQEYLLVTGEWDERLVVLWCAPSSVVRAFDSLENFALALRDDLAERYRFDEMTWDRYCLEGNVFAQQSALLLDAMLERISALRYSRIEDVQALEQLFRRLSDPSQVFYSGYFIDQDVAPVPPPGLVTAKADDSFAWQEALFTLSLYQLESQGFGALDGIEDLNSYTTERLSADMRQAHPQDSPAPDDILLELKIAAGVPGGAGVGAGGGEPLVRAGSKTLTEFAIGNLASLGGAIITDISCSGSGPLPRWLDSDYVRHLVARVDIGGRYPKYVAERLDERQERPTRVERFSREWRIGLLFAALQAKLDGRLGAGALQCVTDYCRGYLDDLNPATFLVPLAFKRRPDSTVHDIVSGMYVLLGSAPSVLVLYRPLYGRDAVRAFASEQALVEAICQDTTLQQSILDWLPQHVRPIYDNGGFAEPHILSIGVDPFLNFEAPAPASLAIRLWETNVDEKLYAANRDLLVELADLRSTSNAENRWLMLLEGAWLLFNTATLFLRGPIASFAWLVQSVSGLESDLRAIADGDDFDRSAASVDVLLTLGMALAHLRQPARAALNPGRLPDVEHFEGPPRRGAARQLVSVVPRQGKVGGQGGLGSMQERQLDFSWRGNQGFNGLLPSQRIALRAMRAALLLDGLAPLESGQGKGAYQVGAKYYVLLGDDSYEVVIADVGVRVVDAKGSLGPWLSLEQGAWRVDSGLRLRAGMPRQSLRARLDEEWASTRHVADELTVRAEQAAAAFKVQGQEVMRMAGQLEQLALLKRTEAAKESADDAMIERYEARMISLESTVKAKRLESVATVETVIRLGNEKLPLLERMLEPKYGLNRMPGTEPLLGEERASLRCALISNNDFVLNELWRLADYPRLKELADDLGTRNPFEAKAQYQFFRQSLENVVGLQERMLLASAELDALLAGAAPDLLISGGGESRSVAQIVEQRPFTTEDLRFHHVLNLADLALHLDSPSGQAQLSRYRADLAGKTLQSSANAHGESITANLEPADRITILQEAWDEYSAAILNSELIAAQGGRLVEPDMLKRYQAHMQLLKADAGQRLIEARNALEARPDSTVAPGAYRISTDIQHAIRNSEGITVIASEMQEDGHKTLVVRDPLSNAVVQRFDLQDGRWVERVDEAPLEPVSQAPSASALDRVKSVLAFNKVILAQAVRYLERDLGGLRLARLFDEPLARLRAIEAQLSQGDEDALDMLNAGRSELQAGREQYLTELYTRTCYPSAEALRYLHERQLIKVEYIGPRRTMADGSAFDEYKVTRLKKAGEHKGKALWAAHFHLASADALSTEFTRGHLKLWAQRFESNRGLGAASEVVPGKRVHYGPLSLAEAQGIIPF
ncbi:dermonecrotic toxin domain-containing protein [Pseudomonas soli]|uniref:dermonecrotic toxin domain-containing protein n=1 Tax=Pseudomonas soli TaxID=1306993 RepID=UPI003803926E